MADIFREVDEDLRQERYLKLWRRFRYYVIGVLVVALGAAVAYVVVSDMQARRREDEATRFAAAADELAAGRPRAAAESFAALADDVGSGYAALARIRAADALAQAGDVDGAVARYDQLAADGSVDAIYREFAVLLAAERLVDRRSAAEIDQRLAPLVIGESAWRPLAQEILGLAALRAGQLERAREIFEELSIDMQASPGVRQRAAELLASLGGPAASEAADAAAAGGGD